MIEQNIRLINALRCHLDALETNLNLFNAMIEDKSTSDKIVKRYHMTASVALDAAIDTLRVIQHNTNRTLSVELYKRGVTEDPFDLEDENLVFKLDADNRPMLNLGLITDVQLLNSLFDYERYNDLIKEREAELCSQTENH